MAEARRWEGGVTTKPTNQELDLASSPLGELHEPTARLLAEHRERVLEPIEKLCVAWLERLRKLRDSPQSADRQQSRGVALCLEELGDVLENLRGES